MKNAPKDTSRHPWRKSNSNLKNYSRKALAEKKKQNLNIHETKGNDSRTDNSLRA
jgi:hypothetical protein